VWYCQRVVKEPAGGGGERKKKRRGELGSRCWLSNRRELPGSRPIRENRSWLKKLPLIKTEGGKVVSLKKGRKKIAGVPSQRRGGVTGGKGGIERATCHPKKKSQKKGALTFTLT